MNSQLYDEQFKCLADLGSVGRGKSKHRPRNAPELYGGAYPFIQTGDVKHSKFYITSFNQTYSDKGLAQSKLWQPGTLCITIAANIADTAILTFPACFPDSIIGFIPKKGVADVKFVKYCLDTYKQQIQLISQGTTQDNLSLEKLLSIRLLIPPFSTQKKIAAVLSAYDDLIENNKRRIALLEKMAEEIYREWFVRLRFPGHEKVKVVKGVPEGWERVQLQRVCSLIKRGIAPSYNDTAKFLVINQRCIRQGCVDLSDARPHDTNIPTEKYIKFGDVLINSTGVGTLGRVAVFDHEDTNMTCDTHVTICRPKHDVANLYYVGHTVRLLQTYFENMAVGSTGQSELGRDLIGATKILRPPVELQSKFEKIVAPMWQEKRFLFRKTINLKNTRDMLLPRLISGKLSVESLDIRFPPGMEA